MPTKSTANKSVKTATAKKPSPVQASPPASDPSPSPNRKPIYLGLGLLIILLLGAYLFKNQFVVATVNGQYITRAAFIKELEQQGGQQVLDQLITEKLILAEANDRGLTIPPETITAEIDALKARVEGQGMSFDEALLTQGTTLSQLRRQITLQRLVAALSASSSAVTDADIDTYIETNADTLPDNAADNQELREAIKDQLAQNQQQDAVNQWLEDLKARADIQYW